MVNTISQEFTRILKSQVEGHQILKHPWIEAQKHNLVPDDLYLWLTQEYYVSLSFVNWFLFTASLTNNQSAKIILVQNIWEELGEGDIKNTHVSILEDFLKNFPIPEEYLTILPETNLYLARMADITKTSFYHGLGALGPANEYLLKLEYSEINLLYNKWKIQKPNLPEAKFFQVNLEADEGHSKRLFELIEKVADDDKKKNMVIEGNLEALTARTIFYDGLEINRISARGN